MGTARLSAVATYGPAAGGDAFGQLTDNEAKYEGSGAVETRLLARFRAELLAQVVPLAPASCLDAGCGEGHVVSWLRQALPGAALTGVDGRPEAVEAFRTRNPGHEAVAGDLRALPFPDDCFDLVLCTEVLEHLEQPGAVLRELGRVSRGHVMVTVPHEPFFRAGNLARGRYVARLGSTPGHLSTWSRRGLRRLLSEELEVVQWFSAFPWQGAVARP